MMEFVLPNVNMHNQGMIHLPNQWMAHMHSQGMVHGHMQEQNMWGKSIIK